jgi:dTMP kinase
LVANANVNGDSLSKENSPNVKYHFDESIVAALRDSPLFIVFEGIDGSGKTTQAKMLADRLAEAGVPVLLTAEPSDSPAGLAIKSMTTRLPAEEEARLFTEDRRDHVQHVIKPALKKGCTVVCDRYVYSSVAYQGARGIDAREIISANSEFAPAADITFLLEIPVEEALSRIAGKRPEGFSPFELKEDLMAVDVIYRKLTDSLVYRVGGAHPVGHVHEMILEILIQTLEQRMAGTSR